MGKKSTPFSLRTQNGHLVVQVRGVLDGSKACQIEEGIKGAMRQSGNSRLGLILDLSQVRAFEHFGVALLAGYLRQWRSTVQEIRLATSHADIGAAFSEFTRTVPDGCCKSESPRKSGLV